MTATEVLPNNEAVLDHDNGPAGRHDLVVGVDGSPSSVDALQWAAALASQTGAEIEAITCWQYPTGYGLSGGPLDWNPADDAAQLLTNALAAAFGDKHPDGLRSRVCEGHPARVLIEAGASADMLVVGSRGHGGFVGLLIGSVSGYCAEHANCPVVVVRPRRAAPAP